MSRTHRPASAALLTVLCVGFLGLTPAHAGSAITGSGSSFAGIEFIQWAGDVARSPYKLTVNYTSSSSGAGRQQFKDNVVDFAVSDIRYNKFDGAPPPDGTYIYVPVTAGGIAVMYNLKKHGFGESSPPIKLTSYTLCGIFTGAIPYWDDQNIARDNPGVALPHVLVTPVVRSDPAGTNFVMEEYCIETERAMYFAFADAATRQTGQDYPHEPTSTWPLVKPLVGSEGSEGVANVVAGGNNDGYVTAVETGYASQRHFPVAAMKNGNGNFVLPTEPNVGAALSYARQLSDGTHVLDFSPPAVNAYNPSTYSYMLVRTKGRDQSVGATVTAFANYALTIGQKKANSLRYASIGRNLILYGLEVIKQVPGYVEPTAEELAAIPATEQFNTKIAVARGATSATKKTATRVAGTKTTNRSVGGAAELDPSAHLDGIGPLGNTGANLALAGLGLTFAAFGEVGRRALVRRRRA